MAHLMEAANKIRSMCICVRCQRQVEAIESWRDPVHSNHYFIAKCHGAAEKTLLTPSPHEGFRLDFSRGPMFFFKPDPTQPIRQKFLKQQPV